MKKLKQIIKKIDIILIDGLSKIDRFPNRIKDFLIEYFYKDTIIIIDDTDREENADPAAFLAEKLKNNQQDFTDEIFKKQKFSIIK